MSALHSVVGPPHSLTPQSLFYPTHGCSRQGLDARVPANLLCLLPGDHRVSDSSATLPGGAAFKPSVAIIILRAGNLNESAF